MSGLKAIYLLLAFTVLTTQALCKTSRELKLTTENPYTVSIGTVIYTVSKTDNQIRVASSFKNFHSCRIPVDPVKDKIEGRIKAVALGSSKIIVYGVHSSQDVHTVKTVHHTILLIDPVHCELKRLTGLIPDKTPVTFPAAKAEIIVRPGMKFDVFYLGPHECAPCRFDGEGRRIPLHPQVQSDTSLLAGFHVQPLERSGGYAYAVGYFNGSTALKVLDSNMKVTNRLALTHSLFDFATSSNPKKSYIGTTYNTANSPYEFYYTLYDSTLHQVFTKRIGSLGRDYLGLGAQLKIDSRGNSFVSALQMSQDSGDTTITLVVYDASGKIIGNFNEFAKVSGGNHEVQNLIVDDREYCLVLHILDEPQGKTKIKCIDITKKL